MAIEFITTVGTSDATSYATVAQYKQYWLNRGLTITDADDVIKALLNIATAKIDSDYNFKGVQSYPSIQVLQWPRSGVFLSDSNYVFQTSYMAYIPCNTIPTPIVNATCHLARVSKVTGKVESDAGISSESYGAMSRSYNRSGGVKYPEIDKMLSAYIQTRTVTHRVK
jgi:hypothetical protein